MVTHIRLITYKGVQYLCRDVGCDDFDRAKINRQIVASRMFTTAYQMVENWLATSPLSRPFPSWVPIGRLPSGGRVHSSYDPALEVVKNGS